MSLRDRVKAIFRKYGFTTIAILKAVSVIIGAIINSLKSGLSNVAKGNGLKTSGKKLVIFYQIWMVLLQVFYLKQRVKLFHFLVKIFGY